MSGTVHSPQVTQQAPEQEQTESRTTTTTSGVSNSGVEATATAARGMESVPPPEDLGSLLDWFSQYETTPSNGQSYAGAGGSGAQRVVPQGVIWDQVHGLMRRLGTDGQNERRAIMEHPRLVTRYISQLTDAQVYDLNFLATFGHADDQRSPDRAWTPEFIKMAALKRSASLRLTTCRVEERSVGILELMAEVSGLPGFQQLKLNRRFHEDLRQVPNIAQSDGDPIVVYDKALEYWGLLPDVPELTNEAQGLSEEQAAAARQAFERIVRTTAQ
ncbi:MAG: hypothetical protein KJO07_13625, partial [Deltaproteobacteria bacterium]|nr:hypothetical protein [Deltaproteobacteria bacterium]